MSRHPESRPEPDGYLVERVRDALAGDPAVGVLDVEVRVVGDRVFLTGDAGTAARAEAAAKVVRELCPDHEVHNEMSASSTEAAAASDAPPEELS